MGLKTYATLAFIVAVFMAGVVWTSRGAKIDELENQIEVTNETDKVVDEIRSSVPAASWIDSVLRDTRPAVETDTSADRDQKGM